MGENGISKDGPCFIMSCLGIAQSYAGKDLLPSQLNDLFAGSAVAGNVGADIIKAGLDQLGVDTSKLEIRVVPSPDKTVDSNAFATLRHVGTRLNPDTAGHWQEGTTEGGGEGSFKWDPLEGVVNIGRKVQEVRNVYIVPTEDNK